MYLNGFDVDQEVGGWFRLEMRAGGLAGFVDRLVGGT
jgi:hypothetical protein